MYPLSLARPFDLPQLCRPSQADWLNDLSSTPPVSVTIATLRSVFALLFDADLSRLPHAASVKTAAAANPRPNTFLFINVPPPEIFIC